MEENKKKGLSESSLEIIIAILLAITALLSAWAGWIGSLHGGNQATNYTLSNNTAADGNARWNEASQKMMQDMILWNEIGSLQLEIMYAQSSENAESEELSTFKLYYLCLENLDERMAAAIDWDSEAAQDLEVDYISKWMESENATVSPFSNEEFIEGYYEDAVAVLAESEEILKKGQADNTNGDKFGLVTVFYSLVLFLLGIAGTFKQLPNRTVITAVGALIMIVGTIYMLFIPMPTGFNLLSFFG